MKILVLSALLCALALTKATENQLQKRLFWSCKTDWTKHNGRCFQYVPRTMNWADAEKHCQSIGGHLASVKDKGEYDWIQHMINTKGHGYPEAWLGGYTRTDKQWFWADGESSTFTFWCKGEPNHDSQQCLQMNHSNEKCWDNLQCSNNRPSICVYKPTFLG